ncbi:MAG: winged helix-turn-helix domain-containing protein [Methylococcales bacterium]|nr:winged helix-turn-helix domain-containing protein [Methylococcales bacterium]
MNSTDTTPRRHLPRTKLAFRLMYRDEIALGPGKIDLLEAIDRTGSISAAGKSMNMSYRRAWMLVDVMNRCFTQPLVQTAKGGQNGGGAMLTPLGRQVVDSYKQISQALTHTMEAYLPLFAGLLHEEGATDGDDADSPAAD